MHRKGYSIEWFEKAKKSKTVEWILIAVFLLSGIPLAIGLEQENYWLAFIGGFPWIAVNIAIIFSLFMSTWKACRVLILTLLLQWVLLLVYRLSSAK